MTPAPPTSRVKPVSQGIPDTSKDSTIPVMTSDDNGSDRSKAATTPEMQEARMKAQNHTSYRDSGGWKVLLSNMTLQSHLR